MSAPEFTPTPMDQITPIIDRLRRGFANRSKKSLEQRLDRLHAFVRLINENEDAFCQALYSDLRKHKMECHATELDMLKNELWTAINNLKDWMKPTHVHKVGIQKFDGAYTIPDPLGTVAVLGSWNYPCQLLLLPAVGAIAAGNTVVLKPSEISANTAMLIAKLIPKYFEADDVAVINGGVAETTAVLKERFDHIFYTGSGFVGKIIASAAAKHLTPVTLELGGKSPAIVDAANCDLEIVARRVMWSKVVNAGQTCIAADYVLIQESKRDEFVDECRKAVKEFMGGSDDAKSSESYGRIVSDAHFKRLMKLLPSTDKNGGSSAAPDNDNIAPDQIQSSDNNDNNSQEKENKPSPSIVVGGKNDAATRFIEPTIVINPDLTSQLMTDEIFGPILPIVTFKNKIQEAIDFVNARDKPLALYIFSKDADVVDTVLENTSSGGVTINDTLLHITCESLGFGGVGPSGQGAYHGKLSFEVFSHKKAVYEKPQALEFANTMVRYPPYDDKKLGWIKFLTLYEGHSYCCLPSLHATFTFLLFVAVVVLAVLFGLKENC